MNTATYISTRFSCGFLNYYGDELRAPGILAKHNVNNICNIKNCNDRGKFIKKYLQTGKLKSQEIIFEIDTLL